MNNMNGMNQQNGNGNNNEVSLNYQPNDILQKEFKTKMRGYDPTEVDQFLDGIIKDYETLTNEVGQLKDENDRLVQARNAGAGNNAQNFQQPQQPRQNNNRMRQSKPATSATAEASTNYDILRRVSNLEKRVFGRDFSNGLPEDHETKQFASAVVPNNMNNHNGVESGHTEINPRMNQQPQQPMNNGFNNNPNNFQSNRPMNNGANQNQNNFNGNFSNSNNSNQF